jgi:anaerobic selenocysteine-containing dehydrogenase
MGVLNVLISEDLYDHEFVDLWCFGFDELAEAVKDMTPEKAAEICWIKPEQIIVLARTLAQSKPWAMQWGLPVDQTKHGTAIAQAIVAIMALCGQIDLPGSNALVNIGYVQSDIRMAVSHNVPKEVNEDRLGNRESDLRKYGFISQAMTEAVLKAIETEDPYPIKMLFICSTNTFANMAAEARRIYDAMKTVPFIVCADLWLTPTAVACADVFLPVAMGPERDGIRAWWNPLRTMSKIVQCGEAKSDEEIALDLIKRLNPEEAKWNTIPELLDYVMQDMQTATYKGDFEKLKEVGEYYTDFEYRKYETGKLRANGQPGFNTPTGRIELWSTAFDDFDLPQTTYWKEPTESPVSAPALFSEFSFVLTTGQRAYEFFHSEHRQVETMREFHPDPISEMNPDDAMALGLEDGDWITIENTHGSGKFKLRTNTGMRKGVVNAEHGWWFPEREAAEPSLYGVFESNANMLTVQWDIGPTSYGAPYKNMLCKVYKAAV